MAAKRALKGPLADALRAVADALSTQSTRGMLIGGMAVIARGVPRLTRDVDVTVAARGLDPKRLVEAFTAHDIAPRIADAVDFAEANQVLLLRHAPSGVDVDVSLAWLPFELEAIDASDSMDVGGIVIRVARPEDLIIYKAVAFRPQDRQDIERLLTLYRTRIDLERIRTTIREFADAIEEPDRLAAFDRIVKAVEEGM